MHHSTFVLWRWEAILEMWLPEAFNLSPERSMFWQCDQLPSQQERWKASAVTTGEWNYKQLELFTRCIWIIVPLFWYTNRSPYTFGGQREIHDRWLDIEGFSKKCGWMTKISRLQAWANPGSDRPRKNCSLDRSNLGHFSWKHTTGSIDKMYI